MKTASALIALIASLPSFAAVPDVFTYAGSLRRGDVPADGTFSVVVSLFGGTQGGTPLFTQADASFPVTAGELIIDLGADPANPLGEDVLDRDALFLEITVDGEELSPRVPLTSVPFARRASTAEAADNVGGLTAEDIATLYVAGSGLQQDGTTFSLANNAVASAHIVDGSVTSADLDNDSVTSDAIVDGTVSSRDLALGAVTAEHLAFGALSGSALVAGSVSSAALAGNAVTSAAIGNDQVGVTEIGANAVGNSELADDAVTSAEVQLDSLTAADLAPNACGRSELADDAVTSAKIDTGAVGEDALASNSVGSSELRSNSVESSEIAAGAVGASELAGSAVRTQHLSGGGRAVFTEAAACGGDKLLTLASTCQSLCSNLSTPAGCTCNSFGAATCPNTPVGRLVLD